MLLSDQETEKLMGVIDNLRKQGTTCIFISHKLDEVFESQTGWWLCETESSFLVMSSQR